MRILVLGGTAFLSHEVAAQAVARGHEVVCVARGASGAVPAGARLVVWDRSQEPPAEVAALRPDAVVDVARLPSYVRRAVAAFPEAHWTFVSTCNVYADEGTPGGTAAADLREPLEDDVDPESSPEAYGRMKVACERLVQGGTRAALVVRPGLIVGPGDPSGRFAYWPSHAAAAAEDGGPLLAPGRPGDPVQFIDVRDLAAWILDLAEADATGAYDGVAPSIPRSSFLDALVEGVGTKPELRWVETTRLAEAGVEQWVGPGSIPLWLSDPALAGFMDRDVSASIAAGLAPRPVAETVRDTLAWLRADPDAAVTGLSRAEELELVERFG